MVCADFDAAGWLTYLDLAQTIGREHRWRRDRRDESLAARAANRQDAPVGANGQDAAYFMMTGLHAVHLLIAIGIVIVCILLARGSVDTRGTLRRLSSQ